jgi:hypothetical protein
MLAFWLLALLAAVITSLGLRESGATVSVRGAPAAPVTPTVPTQLVLGETLQPAPGLALPSLAVLGHAAAQARPAAAESLTSPSRAPVARTDTRVRSKATTKPATRHHKVRSTSSPTIAPSTSPARHGHGKGLAKGQARGNGPSSRGKSGR